jgi:hypothetical protein
MSDADSMKEMPGTESLLERVDRVCDAFEAAWQSGRRPQIEDCLGTTTGAERAKLLEELLRLELEYRCRSGENPPPEEYQQRFPADSDLIRAVFADEGRHPSQRAAGQLGALGQDIPSSPRSEGIISTIAYGEAKSTVEDPALPDLAAFGELEEIDRGGIGVVYRGKDPQLPRDLAIKVLRPEWQDHPELVRRFIKEAKITGKLQHPGVVPVHSRGQMPDGRPYFTMKLIRGQTLADLLAGRALPSHDLPHFLKIFEQVCQTLAYAHSQGVVHRDLKPGNIMVGAFAEVQVMDWGLAKVLRTPEKDVPETGDNDKLNAELLEEKSRPGQVMGTWPYMPPEQARGEVDRLDERCDVFGLGAILCAILTGKPAYQGTAQEVRAKAESADVADAWHRLGECKADPELIALVRQCLNPSPHERPQNAGVVAEAVAAYQTGVQERLRAAELARTAAQAKAGEERKRRRLTLRFGAIVVLLLIAGTAVALYFAINAAEQAGKAIAANKDLEKANEDLEETLARSLLRPLGLRVQFKWTEQMQVRSEAGPLAEAEVESLWELARHPNKRLSLLFIKNALRNSVTIRQLKNRAEFALHAAVGLDREKRVQVERLLMERLQDPKLNEHERNDIALIAAALGDLTPLAGRQVAQVLLQGITKTPRNEESLEALGAVDSPQEAAQAFAIVTEAMEKTPIEDQEYQRCPEGLWAVAARMEPQAAARVAASLIRAFEKNPRRYWLIDASSAAATAMEPRVGTSAVDEIVAKFTKFYKGPYKAGNFEIPAKALSILARRMEPHAAVTTLTTAIAKVPEFSNIQEWLPLAEGLSALAPRMEPKDAAEAGQILARVLARNAPYKPDGILALSAVARRMDHQSAAKAGIILTEAISSGKNNSLADLAEGLSVLAPRMQPKDAAAAGTVVAERLPDDASGRLAKALSALAVQMEPNDAERICFKVASALIDFAIANNMEPQHSDRLWSVAPDLLALAPHIGPKHAATAAKILRKAIEEAEEHPLEAEGSRKAMEQADSLELLARSLSAMAARMERSEANKLCSGVHAILVRRIGKSNHYYQALSAVAAQMDPNEAARLCSRAAQVLSRKLDDEEDQEARGWNARSLAAVAAHMEPKEGANTLFSTMDRSKGYPFALAALAEGLSEVAGRMPRKEGSGLCTQAAFALIQKLEDQEKRRGLVAAAPFPFQSSQRERFLQAQYALAGSLSVLAARMEPKDAATVLMEIMTKMSNDEGVRQYLAETLWASLTAVYPPGSYRWSVSFRRPDPKAPNAIPYVTLAGFPPVPKHLLAVRLTTRELAELLKQPTCIGQARRVILQELENRYRCRFADQWAFVRYAQENDLGLDLTAPPQRFGSPFVGENIR